MDPGFMNQDRAYSDTTAYEPTRDQHHRTGDVYAEGVAEWADACFGCPPDDDGETPHIADCPMYTNHT